MADEKPEKTKRKKRNPMIEIGHESHKIAESKRGYQWKVPTG